MKRATLIVIALVMALATGGVALAGGLSGSASGGVKYVSIPNNFAQADFTAKLGPNGPQGRVHRRVVDQNGNLVREFVGDVNCYVQRGNVALFSGVVTNSQGADNIDGQYFIWAVQDNGEGANAAPDMISVNLGTTPFDCTTSGRMPTQPVDQGNIQVH